MIEANDPNRTSWVAVPENSDFPIQNLPFGIFSTEHKTARAGVAIGEQVLDLAELAQHGFLASTGVDQALFHRETLNDFISLGKAKTREVRNRLAVLLDQNNAELRDSEFAQVVLIPMSEVQMHLPVHVGDYTDFYSSIDHATNVGTMFRDPNNALLPNWKHIPVGYHGRASSIIPSGVPIHRPKGQTKADDADAPSFGPTRLLDFELEMAFVTFPGKPLSESISTDEAEDYIFGMTIFNDWSARDIQKWEYVPLGPFLAKNFASSISPWIVTMDALDPFRTQGPKQDPAVLPYLEYNTDMHFEIDLEVYIQPQEQEPHMVCHSNYRHMYWNMAQQLAHHTVNGCNINAGDMMASGTISGPTPESYGSMLELSWRGTKPIPMPDGSERKFIQDHDTVIMKGYSQKDGLRIGFGEVSTLVLPTRS